MILAAASTSAGPNHPGPKVGSVGLLLSPVNTPTCAAPPTTSALS
jgi:hypothetical protein